MSSAISQRMIDLAKSLHERNLIAAADGNISCRLSDDEILITPSGLAKSRIEIQDIAVITLDNRIIKGKPSSERLMHLEVYKKCPQAKAIVHAHPPTAIAWSLAFPEMKELPYRSLPEAILAAGKIPVIPYARPGTLEMGTNLLNFLPQNRLMILARHGALCWGEDLEEAYRGIERVEHVSQILKSARELLLTASSQNSKTSLELPALPEPELEELFKLREKIGPGVF
ncbi:MAG: class II aldolase/adducin family protein [Bdellovibrionaceae bacterium]|nr:class II aldolase/adducin family protein [Pseudobdellovibrionaceae bacterium]NUM59981.1 class II aldolase/adducin family protein [Pseudobdellovibrionaceae bacterium]